MRRQAIIILLSFFVSYTAKASLINIGLYDNYTITKVLFVVQKGKYVIYSSRGKIEDLNAGRRIKAVLKKDGSIILTDNDSVLGNFKEISFIGANDGNQFSIKPLDPNLRERTYDDNFILRKKFYFGQLLLINNIDLTKYIAGVVQAEVGKSPPYEYFKLQAIICRTYALNNLNRHEEDGFNLCDGVHCQAYHGSATSSKIIRAAMATKGIVVVDSNMNYITAAFSSNCGGETENSQDVWNKKLYYLQSVKDTFCLHSLHAHWQKKIPLKSWKSYLEHNLDCGEEKKNISCFYNCEQINRLPYFYCDSCKLDLEKMRQDLHLRSTFFSVERKGNIIILKGKGFGHGVGLCQEGSIEMARDGYNFAAILHHYFRGVFLINRNAIDLFKEQ